MVRISQKVTEEGEEKKAQALKETEGKKEKKKKKRKEKEKKSNLKERSIKVTFHSSRLRANKVDDFSWHLGNRLLHCWANSLFLSFNVIHLTMTMLVEAQEASHDAQQK